MQNKTWLLLTICIGILFSGSFLAAKIATRELQPLTITFLRYLVALLFLAALLVSRRGYSIRIHLNDWWRLALLGLSGIIGYHYFFFSALQHTEVVNTAIINATSPVLTAIAAACLIHERLLWRNYLGIVLAVSGVIFLLSKGSFANFIQMSFRFGDVLMLISVLCWIVYALLVKNLSKTYSSFTLTFHATFSGVILLTPLVLTEEFMQQVIQISWASIGAVVYMGAGASAIGYLLYNFSIEKMGPTRTASLVYSLVPIFVALLAWLFLSEPITNVMILSFVFILISLHLVL